MKQKSVLSFLLIMLLLSIVTVSVRASEIFDAVKKGEIVKVRELIKKNPEVINEKNEYNNSPLFVAAMNGQKDIVELLISKGANVNIKNDEGSTPLFGAAEKGYKEIVELLISKGADVNIKNDEGDTAISEAAEEGHSEVVEFLKKNGAK